MYIDAFATFSNPDSPTAVGTTNSANVLDLSANRDLGDGRMLWLDVACLVTATSGGAATLQVQLQGDTSRTFANANSPVFTSAVIPLASLVAGGQLVRVVLPVMPQYRYLRLNYVIAGAALTAGSFFAGLVIDIQNDEYYVRGDNVSGV